MAELGAPLRVSPLIKFGRWSFLTLGVVYGLYHQQRLTTKENAVRKIEAQQKVIRDVKLAEEKKQNERNEAAFIESFSKTGKI